MVVAPNPNPHVSLHVPIPLIAPQAELLDVSARAFLADLHRRFDTTRVALLRERKARQARFDAGELPDFLAETRSIRDSDWRVAPIPDGLLDRRVEITGPVDRKMIINALNSGAKVFMADFEDSTAPTFTNLLEGQLNLRDAVAGAIDYTTPEGKRYELRPNPAVLMVRPRGWHLPEKHIEVDGEAMSGCVVRLRPVRIPQRARRCTRRDRGPYFYLPKMREPSRSRAVERRDEPHRGRARPAARRDQGHRADRDAARGVRDGRDPACAAHAHHRTQLRALGLHLFLHQDAARAPRPRAAGARPGHDDGAVPEERIRNC